MNTSRNILLALATCAALSCADEPLDPTGNEGHETTITLSLTAAPEAPGLADTRALPDSPVVNEGTGPGYRVKDFWLLQFDQDGYRIGSLRYYLMPSTESTTAVAVVLPPAGETYKCVLLANTHADAFDVTLGAVTTLADLETVHKRIRNLEDMYNATDAAPDLFMNGTVDVTSATTALICTLYRNVAKLTLTLTNDSGSGVTITSVQLRNVPDHLFYADRLFDGVAPPSPSAAQSGLFDLPADELDLASGEPVKTLRYYLPRNRQGTTGTSTEALKNTRAPDRATFIEILAVDDGGVPFRYRFYPGANMTNDFNIVPNYHYTLPVVFNSAGAAGDSRVENLGQVHLAESNSYIINPLAGAFQTAYGVPVTRVNRFWGSTDGAAANVLATDSEWEAEVIWQDKANVGLIEFCQADGTVITTGKYEGTGGVSYFYFRPNNRQARGNVLIGVKKKGTTEYLWSWHVWLTGYDPDAAPSAWQEDVYSYGVPGGAVHRYADGTGTTWSTAYADKFIMDRNLGAASADREQGVDSTCGLYYQFGRKDPFPTSRVKLYNVSGTAVTAFTATTNDCIVRVSGRTAIKVAVQYPYNFYAPGTGDWVQSNPYPSSSWNNPGWYISEPKAGKSLFDPCPPGWRVPAPSTWSTFTLPGTTNVPNAANYPDGYKGGNAQAGWEFYMSGSSGATAFYPAAGFRAHNSGSLTYYYTTGYCWAFSPTTDMFSNNLQFAATYVYSQYVTYRGGGAPVRCVQE
ncbi:MAG: DUF4906 domain-containing protein [Odoribacteraceae bacterium]|jgi:hypothetical protein|nr:DUF4906 domain-containing protein [Odoribacteraceae bacterium]